MTFDQTRAGQPITRRRALTTTAVGAAGFVAASRLGFPAFVRAQADVIKIGHLTPLTGFLGQLGEYAVMGASMAVDEANANGGVLGRQVELITEDSVNPGVATQKAQKLIEGDKAACLIGEISSASALAIADVANRSQVVYFNTGANSDALRGSNCNRFMFHVEGCNTMYTKTIGLWQQRQGLIDGAKWYFLTADYAFGHDLYRVSSKFLRGERRGHPRQRHGADQHPRLQRLHPQDPSGGPGLRLSQPRRRRSDHLPQAVHRVRARLPARRRRHGHGAVLGRRPRIALGPLAEPLVPWARQRGLAGVHQKFVERNGKPPENQAWGEYVGTKILLKAISETGGTDSMAIVEYLEGGPEFDILKGRPGKFRDWDHQLLQEMYVVEVKEPSQSKDQWDIFEVIEPQPGPDQDLELIQPTQEENPCNMA